jgi:hypothetical protein
MATVRANIDLMSYRLRSSAYPTLVHANGSAYPVYGLSFSDSADEAAFFTTTLQRYGSGSINVWVDWYATATSGSTVLGISLAAISPNLDSQDVETDSLATENSTISAASTSSKGLTRTLIIVSNLDSVSDSDFLTLRLRRVGTSGSDNMSGPAIVVGMFLTYSDT